MSASSGSLMRLRFLTFVICVTTPVMCLHADEVDLSRILRLIDIRNQTSTHRGELVRIMGRVAGTIVSEKGRTFMIDTGSTGYVYVKNAPQSSNIRNDAQVNLIGRVPTDGAPSTEFDYVGIAPDEEKEARQAGGFLSLDANRLSGDTRTPSSSGINSNNTPAAAQPPTTFDAEVARLKPYYVNAISYFNSRLSSAQRSLIAEAILRFSISNGLDPRLTMSVIAVESSFRPDARSRDGAMGLGQLMPGTAAGMGVSNAYDPIQNVHAAVRLIRGHLNNYKNRSDAFNVALAAYNAGSGAVRKHGGVPPYRETVDFIWKINRLYRHLAPEMFR